MSGVVCIDTDSSGEAGLGEELLREFGPLPETLTIRSGSGRGLHRYYRHPGGYVASRSHANIKIDVKADKGFTVLPPTVHASGGRYTIEKLSPIAPLPHGLLDFIETKAAMASECRRRPGAFLANHGGAATPILDRLEQSFHPIAPAPPAVPREKVAEVVAKHGRHWEDDMTPL